MIVEVPGRPSATIEGAAVCCGHCGGKSVCYVEECMRYGGIWADNGTAYASRVHLKISVEHIDPRLWCAECKRESTLPGTFELLS
jgi:hypothetical protein